jgi:hypothetical protein
LIKGPLTPILAPMAIIPIPPVPILAPMANVPPVPSRGGIHAIHGVFIGGNSLAGDWTSIGQFRYTSQR